MALRDLPGGLARLAAAQDLVLTRCQLRQLGCDRHAVRTHVYAGRWQTVGSQVVVLHGGPLGSRQQLWMALLNAGQQTVALAGRSAAAAHGLTGYESDVLHVVVRNGARVRKLPGIRIHVSRRFTSADLHPSRLPAVVRVERALVDAAVWSPSPRTACAILAAGVQQRLSTAARLRAELSGAGQVRHRKLLLAVLTDIEGGAQSLSEIDFGRLCRRYGLPPPIRQAVRTDRQGRRRYLDATFRAEDGRVVGAEVDGAIHLLAQTYWSDMERANELVIDGCEIVRFSAVAIRLTPAKVAEQLARLLAARPARQNAPYIPRSA